MHSITFVCMGSIGDVLPLLTIAYKLRENLDAIQIPNRQNCSVIKFVSHKGLLMQILPHITKLKARNDEPNFSPPRPINQLMYDERFFGKKCEICFCMLESKCLCVHTKESYTYTKQEIETIICESKDAQILCFNFFAAVCWHVAQKYKVLLCIYSLY